MINVIYLLLHDHFLELKMKCLFAILDIIFFFENTN